MTIKTKLPKDIKELFRAASNADLSPLTDLKEALDEFVSEQEDARSEKSEKWQEGEKAAEHQEFIDALSALRDELDGVLDGYDSIDFENIPEAGN